MNANIETLRPGFLISLKTSVRGNVAYDKRDIERAKVVDGKEIAEWQTKRTIADPVEFDAATKARSKASSLIRGVCINSVFGLLCPEAAQEELDKALTEARKVIDDFNATARITRVSLYTMIGRVADSDAEAVRAINSEVRDLMSDMEEGLKNLDVKAVREAASKAKSIGQMLNPNAQARVQIAVEAARQAASKIAKAGEQSAAEVDLRAIRAVTEARTTFLDLDDAGEVAAPVAAHRAIDLAPVAEVSAPAVPTPAIEV